jgi:superfamily II RNA helicase
MVKVCSLTNYPKENEANNKEYFDKFSYPLHIFQKWAIEGIVNGHHILVTAPTGSGKSLPAEFAIDFFHSKGKKSIYCSPIKSLSNQKFYDFSQKYPHISIGIITGDIRCNPDADVLIMTTEILLNKLYQIKSKQAVVKSSVSFEMDIENELGCVIFDEIHMINDETRGHVWENSIIMLPRHIQMIGLSATLDNPENFANWFENRNDESDSLEEENKKIVYLTSKKVRAVPLTHYSFITVNQGIFKAIKDKSVHEEIKQATNKPFVIQDSKNIFQEEQYYKLNKMLKLFDLNNIRVKRAHALNQISKYLTEHEMTPAICYVFSIKNLELSAKEVTTDLLEFDSKIPYTVARECEQILRSKLPNFEEYLMLPEYVNLVSLLEKGIATHHSKMLPVLREIVEMLFAKGYIKLLFATETVSIGLNLPVKSCIFTDICKHDGQSLRMLHGHEYTQAAGRAGRLGLDTVGHVFHLNNLYRNTDTLSYKTMMNGKPQTLVSKFKISYNLLLNLLQIGDTDFVSFAKKSMITTDLKNQADELHHKIQDIQIEIDNIISFYCKQFKTPIYVIEEYITLHKNKLTAVNKKRKQIEREIEQIETYHKFVDKEATTYTKLGEREKELNKLQSHLNEINSYTQTSVDNVIELLQTELFVNPDTKTLTLKGEIAAQIKETHSLVFADFMEEKKFDNLSSSQLVNIFSCFTNLNVQEEFKDFHPNTSDQVVKQIVNQITEIYQSYITKEAASNINTGFDYTIHYDLLNYLDEWCAATDVESCKCVLQKICEEKHIVLGEFIKALLKINNVSCELEKVCEFIGNIELLGKLKEIPTLTLKYVVTNQSLYV